MNWGLYVMFALRKHAPAKCTDFKRCKNDKFKMTKRDIFLIFVQNIDCGCTLEPSH